VVWQCSGFATNNKTVNIGDKVTQLRDVLQGKQVSYEEFASLGGLKPSPAHTGWIHLNGLAQTG
jgi:hypothetical protein